MESLRRLRKSGKENRSDIVDSRPSQHASPNARLRPSGGGLDPTSDPSGFTASIYYESDPTPLNLGSPVPQPVLQQLPERRHPRASHATEPHTSTGLRVLHTPKDCPSIDIIFVHGLGGSAYDSWTKNNDSGLFWPREWLPLEPVLCSARISAFDYRSDWVSATNDSSPLKVTELAEDLLCRMESLEGNQIETSKVGKLPIIFIAHSLGGLVTKQAYLQGQRDSHFHRTGQSVSAILFLATPHRTLELAADINNILSTMTNNPSNRTRSQSKHNCSLLEETNISFKRLASKLQIFSFYETLDTIIESGAKLRVLDKDASVIGTPGELQVSLDADHFTVSRYASRQDANYQTVRNVLKTLVGRFRDAKASIIDSSLPEHTRCMQTLLGFSEPPHEDLRFFSERRMEGTCQWITGESCFQSWLVPDQMSRCLWLHGLPASGKSILSAYIINYLQQTHFSPHFFFIRFGDQTKRSPSAVLRSLAFQLASQLPLFRQKLREMHDEGQRFEKANIQTIWNKVFVSCLFELDLPGPFYWILDALDESDSPRTLIDLLSHISISRVPIHLLIVSRYSESLSQEFERFSNRTPLDARALGAQMNDLSLYVGEELKYTYGGEAFKERIHSQILDRASGNFLWVTLVMKEILQCHTEESIQKALDEIPSGMEPLYGRMEQLLSANPREEDRRLAKRILTWVVCCRRAMTINELSQALEPEFPALIDLKHATRAVCGQFIVVDTDSNLAMVHLTAKDYLVKTQNLAFSISPSHAHSELLAKCLIFLLDPALRAKMGNIAALPAQPFLKYASTCWHYHLDSSNTTSDQSFSLLVKFLGGPSVLTWIHVLAYFHELSVVVQASKWLHTFASRKKRVHDLDPPLSSRVAGLELIEAWAVDIVKLYAKFGPYLLQEPSSIYKLVPPFCPKDSIIYQQHGKSTKNLSVRGLTNGSWDDCLAQVSLGDGVMALGVQAAVSFFCITTTTGTLMVYDATSLKEAVILNHEEFVFAIAFSKDFHNLISYGYRTSKIWALPSGTLLHVIANPEDCRALTIAYSHEGNGILCGGNDCTVRHLQLDNIDAGWKHVIDDFVIEEAFIPDTKTNSPNCMAISPDGGYLVVGYRGYPTSIWSLGESRSIAKLRRTGERRQDIMNAWSPIDRVMWHPTSGEVVGRYEDGCVFKWNHLEDETEEVRAQASELNISVDGAFFITSDITGCIKVWNYQYFTLVYQLSVDNGITGLCFSPSSMRFYDVNGSICSVWEPNRLIALAETDEKSSEEESEASSTIGSPSSISQASANFLDPITALACASLGGAYCFGNDAGNVQLRYGHKDAGVEVARSSRYLLIDRIACDQTGSTVAFQELGGQIKVYRVAKSASPSMVLEIRQTDGLEQFLFGPRSQTILISTQSQATVWSLESLAEIAILDYKDEIRTECYWLPNPLDDGSFLLAMRDRVRVYSCTSLKLMADVAIDSSSGFHIGMLSGTGPSSSHLSLASLPDSFETTVHRPSSMTQLEEDLDYQLNRAILTQDNQHILLVFKHGMNLQQRASSTARQRVMIIPLSSLRRSLEKTGAEDTPVPLLPLVLPTALMQQIQIPLGVLSQNRLVFLDQNYWVCTYRLDEIGRPRTSFGSTSSTKLSTSPTPSPAVPELTRTVSGNDTNASLANMPGLQRHFFLPRDWLNVECLELCQVMADGTFLIPRKGEVAVVKSSIGRAW